MSDPGPAQPDADGPRATPGAQTDTARRSRACACGGRCWATRTSTGPSRGTTEFTAPFQDLITRYAWGEIWSRPGLTRPERSMITLTALAALRPEEELAMHVRAALRNGLSPEQIGEVLLQVGDLRGRAGREPRLRRRPASAG